MFNFDPSLWPHPTPVDPDFHNFESTLHEDASTEVLAFHELPLVPSPPPPPTAVDPGFHNFESTYPENASTKLSAFLAD